MLLVVGMGMRVGMGVERVVQPLPHVPYAAWGQGCAWPLGPPWAETPSSSEAAVMVPLARPSRYSTSCY